MIIIMTIGMDIIYRHCDSCTCNSSRNISISFSNGVVNVIVLALQLVTTIIVTLHIHCFIIISPASQAPSSITVLMVENEPNHLGVTWTQPAPPGPVCPITNNSVRWFRNETGETVGQVEIIASTAYFITGLKAYTNYTIYVASKTEGGFSPERSAYNTTDQDGK